MPNRTFGGNISCVRPRAGTALFSDRNFRRFTVAAVATIVVLVALVVVHDARLPGARDCPSTAFVRGALAVTVSAPTASAESDLLSCTYRVGSDPDALSIDASTAGGTKPGSVDLCESRTLLPGLGPHACDMTGTKGTDPTGSSVLVSPPSHPGTEIQFTSDSARISIIQLETLAQKTLAARPLPITV